MKYILKITASVLALLALLTLLAACGKNPYKEITGYWYTEEDYTPAGYDMKLDRGLLFTFNEDGTGTWEDIIADADYHNTVDLTYVLKDGKISITMGGQTGEYSYAFSGSDKLVLSQADGLSQVYTKVGTVKK